MALSGEALRARLDAARLYLVCDARGDGRDLAAFLDAALAGGVDLVQLRDKESDEETVLEAAPLFRAAADRHGAIFILNDRPDLVAAAGADGVHVGQDDLPVEQARQLVGAERIVGLSTHTPAQVEDASVRGASGALDYFAVGPVHATPTKPGRPAVGLELIAHAARAERPVPWFAIGGIDAETVAPVVAAGARRAVVVRALTGAQDPAATARALRDALGREAGVGSA